MHHTQRPRERLAVGGGCGEAGMRHLLGTLGLAGRSQCPVSRAEGSGSGSLLHREV